MGRCTLPGGRDGRLSAGATCKKALPSGKAFSLLVTTEIDSAQFDNYSDTGGPLALGQACQLSTQRRHFLPQGRILGLQSGQPIRRLTIIDEPIIAK